jgi:hypothetical protein
MKEKVYWLRIAADLAPFDLMITKDQAARSIKQRPFLRVQESESENLRHIFICPNETQTEKATLPV